jgi:hypothetical protein
MQNKLQGLLVVMPCNLKKARRFGGTYRLYFLDRRVGAAVAQLTAREYFILVEILQIYVTNLCYKVYTLTSANNLLNFV